MNDDDGYTESVDAFDDMTDEHGKMLALLKAFPMPQDGDLMPDVERRIREWNEKRIALIKELGE